MVVLRKKATQATTNIKTLSYLWLYSGGVNRGRSEICRFYGHSTIWDFCQGKVIKPRGWGPNNHYTVDRGP